MTGRTTTPAVITGMIVGSRKRQNRIEQARFLQPKKNRIGAQFRAEAAIAELVVRLPRSFFTIRVANLRFLVSAALEDAQHISGLRNFPAIKRIQFWNYAFGASFLCGRLWKCPDGLRQAVAIVT